MKHGTIPPQGAPSGRRIAGRAQDDHVIDPYQRQSKLHEPTACPQCKAVYHDGAWRWAARPAEAAEALCPACRRTIENQPAGIVTLSGPVVGQHTAELLHLIRHQEDLEKDDHPMNRIIAIDQKPGEITVTTTDIHLPRRIGEAVRHAFHGNLDLRYDEDNYFVRATWSRAD